MQYLVTGAEMKRYDANTIDILGMEPLVLMERAALATAAELEKRKPGRQRILIVAGGGNNGGDGLAVGRLMALAGQAVTFVCLGREEKYSRETKRQMQILQKYGFPIQRKIEKKEYDIIIDALLGIGFNRAVAGEYAEAVETINKFRADGAFIVSVDIPSGVHATAGTVTGPAVRADLTVTYGFAKQGHFRYPGASFTGELAVRDIGITEHSFGEEPPEWFTYSGLADVRMPARNPGGHKGTFGKVLLIAGKRHLAGACILAGQSILRTGTGMLTVITDETNRIPVQTTLPETMISTYFYDLYDEEYDSASEPEGDCADNPNGDYDHPRTSETDTPRQRQLREQIRESLAWADVIVIGPGLGTAAPALTLFQTVLAESKLPLVADADAVNLLSKHPALRQLLAHQPAGRVVLTPHLGEFANLAGGAVEAVTASDFAPVKKMAAALNCIMVCKDARTVVCAPNHRESYLNTSGNSGMATAGSGDVLAGIIGGLLAQGTEPFTAACMGVHLHGLAGDYAAEGKSEYSVTATDLIEALPVLLKKVAENQLRSVSRKPEENHRSSMPKNLAPFIKGTKKAGEER